MTYAQKEQHFIIFIVISFYVYFYLIFEKEEKTNPLLPKSKDIFNFMIGLEIMAFVK